MSQAIKPKRILVVDDNPEIHKDFRRILLKKNDDMGTKTEAMLFGSTESTEAVEQKETQNYQIDSAYQGKEALELVRQALASGQPYALAFMDVRMPPGWDGIETIKHIWSADPNIQVVICSAYSDHSWGDITKELGDSDNLLILKKPFEVIEINQLACALTKKWELLSHLHSLVESRTNALQNSYSLSKTTLESIREGILAVSLDGSIVTYNNNFLEQWGISVDFLRSKKAPALFENLATQTENPVMFLDITDALNAKRDAKKTKECQVKSGKVLELFTRPQYLDNEIIGIVYSFQDITERKQLEKQLAYQATHDVLTGLPNRALFQDRIKQALAHAKRFNLFVGVLQIDLDFFKQINDTMGHGAGDELLKSVAKKISGFMREVDTIARIGGDEFVAVFAAQTDEQSFIGILKRFSALFTESYQIENQEVAISASIGVSIYPRDGQDVDVLLKNADAALYKAKALGRNRFQFYIDEFNKQVVQHTELQMALKQALRNNELSLQYQPLIDLKSGNTIGVEALLRWQHPTMGAIAPQQFIPIAEESGLIIPIGEWVLRTACKQMQSWHQLPELLKLIISVNISVNQFREANFVSTVRTILAETKMDPACLELEITEGLILTEIEKTAEKMQELKTMGIHFAIDDFGTGYSTLSYLKYFQFDTVKIDKAFIKNITTDVSNASIVEAIIGMTKHMGINVLAEGVEQQEQVTFLKEHHGNQVQGYYFSKPLSTQACTEFLCKKH